MRILSIDIGIRNLAHCLMSVADKKVAIHDWDVVDLTGNDGATCCHMDKKKCAKKAEFEGAQTWCKKHRPEVPSLSGTKEQLIERCAAYHLTVPSGASRDTAYTALAAYKTEHQTTAVKKVADCSPVMLATKLLEKYTRFDGQPIDMVVIENQIGPLAARMKALQGMVVQYWVMKGVAVQVVSACNKLKMFGDAPETYAERKQASIEHTRRLLGEWGAATAFETHKKKDDLADTLLQGMWYLRSVKLL
jgi:hypothetical protein